MIAVKYLTMATNGDKPKMSERFRLFFRGVLDFVFSFKSQRGEALQYECYHADGFTMSPQEFYTTVEQQLGARKIPGLEMSRIHFLEGDPLSERREYLRVLRERLSLDICAAPFGNIYFFSIRTVYVRATVRLWHLLAVFFALGMVNEVLTRLLGAGYATLATLGLLVAIGAVMRNVTVGGGSDLDAWLLKLPVLGTIYEEWFRVDTYYREDTRNLFLQLFPQFIHGMAEDACAAKGFKLVPYLQPLPPVLDLNKPVPPVKRPGVS
jgi:hypothetical protein